MRIGYFFLFLPLLFGAVTSYANKIPSVHSQGVCAIGKSTKL